MIIWGNKWILNLYADFSGGLVVKKPPTNAGNLDLIPGLGRVSGKGNGNTLQYSCLGNPMDRAAWWARVHGVAIKLDIT